MVALSGISEWIMSWWNIISPSGSAPIGSPFPVDRDPAARDDSAVAIELRAQFPGELLRGRSDDFEIVRLQRLSHAGRSWGARERVLKPPSRFLRDPRARGKADPDPVAVVLQLRNPGLP